MVLVGAALAVSAAACGSGGGAEGEVEAALRTVLLSHDPGKCTEVATQNLVEQETAVPGKEALHRCREEATEKVAHIQSVKISRVEIDGDRAAARVAAVGGGFAGQTVSVSLVEEDGGWKLDELLHFVEFDRAALVVALEKTDAEREESPPAQISCIGAAIAHESQGEIETLLLRRDESAELAMIRKCPEHEFSGTAASQIAQTLTAFFRGKDSSKCIELATPAFLEQTEHLKARAALAKCFQDDESTQIRPRLVVVRVLRADRGEARADVELTGITLDHQVFELALVERGGSWRIDHRMRLVHVDKAGYAKEVLAVLRASEVDLTKTAAVCVRHAIVTMTKEQFEDLIFDPQLQRSHQIHERCLVATPKAPGPA
jgi:hypothetical protein